MTVFDGRLTRSGCDRERRLIATHTTHLRGHSCKLSVNRCRLQLRQNFFSQRVINDWNKLPEDVVDAPSVNSFKNRPDTHWKNTGYGH